MKKELIRYRQRKGRETLEDAALLFHSGRLFSALNRIYYALLYEINVHGRNGWDYRKRNEGMNRPVLIPNSRQGRNQRFQKSPFSFP